MACSCRPNSCRKCKGLGFSVTFRMLTSSAVGKDTASNNKTALQFCEIKVFITMTAEILLRVSGTSLHICCWTLKRKKKGQEGKNSILPAGVTSQFFFHQMEKVRGPQVCIFFANGDKRSIRISENRNCNANLNVNQKKKDPDLLYLADETTNLQSFIRCWKWV